MDGHNILVSAFFFLAAAVVVVPFARRGGLGSVLGYLVAGVLIGPYALGLVANAEDILHFAEFGVVMMLFLVGLELEPAKLWRLRVPILGMGGAQVVGTTLIIALVALMLGQTWQSGVAIGMALAMSSTAIALQILNERHVLGTSAGQSAFSVLLFQDIAVIPILAVLPLLAAGGLDGGGAGAASDDGPAWLRALTVISVVAGIVLAGRYALRPMFRFIAGSGIREIFTATALLLVVGTALLMQLIGLSPALGTFLAGVVLANSEYRLALESDIEPFKALLLGLFFISVGMSINFGMIGEHPMLIGALVVGLIAVKLAALVVAARSFGLRGEQNLLFSFVLAQGGEFAFVLFQFATAEGALAPDVAEMMVVVVALSMAATPLLMLLLDRVLRRVRPANDGREPDKIEPEGHPVIVIGYGRFGQIVGRFLAANGVGMVILDNDPDHVEVLRQFGTRAFYGDATRIDLLERAGGETAKLFVVAIDDRDKTVATVQAIRERFPHAKVFARARNRDHVYDLWGAGAHFTRRETFDSALVMGREALVTLGEHPFAARRRARMFVEHDEKMLTDGYSVRDSDESLVKLSVQAREQLERLVAVDKSATAAEKDHGWGD
jgi:glutathione-regulated potassium-efflux system ancillary protein KefC